jgi:hypothetical protein
METKTKTAGKTATGSVGVTETQTENKYLEEAKNTLMEIDGEQLWFWQGKNLVAHFSKFELLQLGKAIKSCKGMTALKATFQIEDEARKQKREAQN